MIRRVLVTVVGLVAVGATAHVSLGQDPDHASRTVIGRVTAVSDGDTLRVSDDAGQNLGKVRMLGINAPELADDNNPEQCWAQPAASRLAQLASPGTTVQLATDSTQADRDTYGRLLRYVQVDGQDLQLTLLAEGYAVPFWPRGHGSRSTSYLAAAREAEHDHRGLWAACPPEGTAR
jgi:micrococcal nuclease